jgi:excinuclease ABC subunit B
MSAFHLTSEYKPTGDQPEAIKELIEGLHRGDKSQVLLGVTGSGKTFTIANVIENIGRPTLVLSHNKTLAAQLYDEFKGFFPDNAVEYYVSYYDYYQPEAYIPSSGKYIEKSLDINDEIDRLRLSALSALLSGRNDVIVVSSVSCIYGMGNPGAFYDTVIELKQGMKLERDMLLRKLVSSLYTRNDIDVKRGEFRVKGDTVDIALAYSENLLRVTFWDNEVDTIEEVEPLTMHVLSKFDEYKVYPANLFVTTQEQQEGAIKNIQDDLTRQIDYFNEIGKPLEAERIKERTEYDMEMIKEVGYCSGIENYSRYFDGREPGTRPYCLLDFFPKDYLMVIDESHVSVPQINAMYGGDRARKTNLVEYGFRLPAAFDNRPLKFEEFEQLTNQVVYISATPADYELQQAEGVVVEQLIRPTGLLDPEIEVRPSDNQVDDLMDEINSRCKKDERVLVTTLTKRMAEELTQYLLDNGVSATYIHSDVILEDRVKILENLRNGTFDVLVGVNLLREGLDLPEVSLVAILDADKEGFLRSNRSLTQTAGRAARNVNGKVIFYANTITKSMQQTMDETSRRREKQLKYNEENHITPTQIKKALKQSTLIKSTSAGTDTVTQKPYIGRHEEGTMVADPITERMTADQLKKSINHTEEMMKAAAKQLDFLQAAQYRDELIALQDRLQNMTR